MLDFPSKDFDKMNSKVGLKASEIVKQEFALSRLDEIEEVLVMKLMDNFLTGDKDVEALSHVNAVCDELRREIKRAWVAKGVSNMTVLRAVQSWLI